MSNRTLPSRLDKGIRRHLTELGFESVESYRSWASREGFGRKLPKNERRRERERERRDRERADQRLRETRALRRRDRVLKNLRQNDVDLACLGDLKLRNFVERLQGFLAGSVQRERLIGFLVQIDQRSNLLLDERNLGAKRVVFVDALIAVESWRPLWLRPLKDWRPEGRCPRRVFASLLRHLFANYAMPKFLDGVWFRGVNGDARREQRWYLHLGCGASVKKLRLPTKLTRRMRHVFLQAPCDLDLAGALRRAQVLGEGGDSNLLRAVLASSMRADFGNDEFWITLIRYFIRYPELSPKAHFEALVAFLRDQRLLRRGYYGADGRQFVVPPPRPNLTLKGRSPQNLLGELAVWRREMGLSKGFAHRVWTPKGVLPFLWQRRLSSPEPERWTIHELCSSSELISEGREQRHCVSDYAGACLRGLSSIWSLRLNGKRCLTIEVTREGRVKQALGRCNRGPLLMEQAVLERWSAVSGFELDLDH